MISKVIIEVIDEGPGIKESEQHLIFKKFAKISSKPTGRELTTGLGLAITKLITNILNADIEFESQIGKGSKFIFKFPANGIKV
jgi:signal transduction histidine kinase